LIRPECNEISLLIGGVFGRRAGFLKGGNQACGERAGTIIILKIMQCGGG
jgi:hypothetical protein